MLELCGHPKEQYENIIPGVLYLLKMNQQTYGFLNIYYATTSGNSRKMANDFKDYATTQGFLPIICNLGDFTPERFLTHKLAFFFISTYGQGGPTEDAEKFIKYLESFDARQKPLQAMKMVIFGLGNSSFEFFCGMPKRARELLLNLGAHEIQPMFLSDAKSQEPMESYKRWKRDILQSVIHTLNLQKVEVRDDQLKHMARKFSVTLLPDQLQNWDKENYDDLNLNFQIKKYLGAEEAEVLEIKEIRRSQEGRSTLYIRMKTKSTELSPACNIEVYPQNVIQESEYQGSIQFSKAHLLPFPPMPIKELMKIVNVSSKPTKSLLQEAMIICENPELSKKYNDLIDQPSLYQSTQITSEDILKELDLGIQHKASLGINNPRVYTLAGWRSGEIELIVSLYISNGKLGLTSKYLQSRPKKLRIKVLPSSFDLPQDSQTPLVMIANGSGIAPFRSILHYYLNHDCNISIPPLHLYYGCQRLEDDYYFRQEWEEAQSKGIIKLHIATSREGEKQYIQKLIKNESQSFKELLFEKNARFFICGSKSMEKQVNNLFVAAYKESGLKSYSALTKVKELFKERRIVKEIYDY